VITIIGPKDVSKNKMVFSLDTKENILRSIVEISKKEIPIKDGTIAAAVAAFGYYFLALEGMNSEQGNFLDMLDDIADELIAAKPSSVNLFWCINRLYYRAAEESPHKGKMLEVMQEEAENIQNEIDDIIKCISAEPLNETKIKDVQIIELMLFFCQTSNYNKRRNIRKTAVVLIEHFGTFHNLLEADALEISASLGSKMPEKTKQSIGVLLSAMLGAYMRYQVCKLGSAVLDRPEKAAKYVKALLYGKTIEHLYLLLLDKNNNLLDAILIGKGTVDSAAAYPREFARVALKHKANARYAVLAHNHPSGNLCESPDDIIATIKAKDALEVIGIRVVDHIIIAGEGYKSFAETSTKPFDYN